MFLLSNGPRDAPTRRYVEAGSHVLERPKVVRDLAVLEPLVVAPEKRYGVVLIFPLAHAMKYGS